MYSVNHSHSVVFNMDFLILDSDIMNFLSTINNTTQVNQIFLFTIMKYPFSYLFGMSDYVIIVLCSLTSFLLLSNISQLSALSTGLISTKAGLNPQYTNVPLSSVS